MAPPKEVEDAFQSTFRLIFGECYVRLDDLKDYLTRWQPNPVERRSSLTGKRVVMASDRYPPHARIIAQDEIGAAAKLRPLDINQIKDVDSVVEALSERFYYAGNKAFGSSDFVEESDNCTDSFHVYRSHNVQASKYVAYSSYIREMSEYAFGCSLFLRGKFNIRTIDADSISRGFETYLSVTSSDTFFCYNCADCQDVMFSLNLRSKRNCIGNLELPKERYLTLKKKLADESRLYLEKHKTFYSIFDFAPPKKGEMPAGARGGMPARPAEKFDMKPIQEAFDLTCKVVLGRPVGALERYEKFLSAQTKPIAPVRTPFGDTAYFTDIIFYSQIPKSRMVNFEEAKMLLNKTARLPPEDGTTIPHLLAAIAPLAYFSPEFQAGEGHNNAWTQIVYHAINSYKVYDTTYTKNSAYDTMAFNTEAVFGCYRAIHSKFCIRCHDCVNVTASMDLDSCTNCSDCLFCHNCENVENGLFCFNAKGMRYAIGNVEVGREKYLQVRKLVQEELVRRLEKDGDIGWDICSLGAHSK